MYMPIYIYIYIYVYIYICYIPSGFIKCGKLGSPLEIGVSLGQSPVNSVFFIVMFDCRRVIIHGCAPRAISWLINHSKYI